MIKRLFAVDEETAELKLSYEERKKLRTEKSSLIINETKDWLDKHQPLARPNSGVGVAINYTLNNWKELIVFLKDGRLELSTNWIENKIRPFCVGRRNWLFFETDNGASAGCVFYSLIETAKANGLDPKKYLERVFTDLPKCKTLQDFEKLLPYDRTALKTKLNID
jgi:transposase